MGHIRRVRFVALVNSVKIKNALLLMYNREYRPAMETAIC